MFQIEARGLVLNTRNHPPSERIAFFPGLCLLRSGDILCGCQLGSTKHAPDSTIRLCRSRDGGTTWNEIPFRFDTTLDGMPGSLATVEMMEVRPGRLLLVATWFDRSERDRPLFDPVTEGILHSKLLLAVSTDEGETWSDWQILPTPGLTGCSATGPLLSWGDDTIACAFESFKEFDDPRPGRHAAWLMTSTDGGNTFTTPVRVAQHPEHKVYYWDQRLCPTRIPGEFVALFWTHDLEQQRDLHVHCRWGNIAQFQRPDSSDATTAIHETTIPGQIAAPLWMEDGTLLAFVVDRTRPGTMRLWVSHDRGVSWPPDESLVVHTHEERASVTQGRRDIDFRAYWEDMGKWSFGHPVIRSLGDGRVLLVWYAGDPDCMSIHWARMIPTKG